MWTNLFAQQSAIVKHIEVQKEEKPYNCAECEKTFRLRYHLIVYRKTDIWGKPMQMQSLLLTTLEKSIQA